MQCAMVPFFEAFLSSKSKRDRERERERERERIVRRTGCLDSMLKLSAAMRCNARCVNINRFVAALAAVAEFDNASRYAFCLGFQT